MSLAPPSVQKLAARGLTRPYICTSAMSLGQQVLSVQFPKLALSE